MKCPQLEYPTPAQTMQMSSLQLIYHNCRNRCQCWQVWIAGHRLQWCLLQWCLLLLLVLLPQLQKPSVWQQWPIDTACPIGAKINGISTKFEQSCSLVLISVNDDADLLENSSFKVCFTYSKTWCSPDPHQTWWTHGRRCGDGESFFFSFLVADAGLTRYSEVTISVLRLSTFSVPLLHLQVVVAEKAVAEI